MLFDFLYISISLSHLIKLSAFSISSPQFKQYISRIATIKTGILIFHFTLPTLGLSSSCHIYLAPEVKRHESQEMVGEYEFHCCYLLVLLIKFNRMEKIIISTNTCIWRVHFFNYQMIKCHSL